MAQQRSTFAKLQRDRDKKERAALKAAKRANKSRDDEPDDDAAETPAVDQAVVLDALAELHERFDAGSISMEEFETRREQLTSMLQVD